MVDIAVPKKRGRPAKGLNSSAAPAAVVSPNDDAPAITKKRGRPSKSKGRGRPPKVVAVSGDNEDVDQNKQSVNAKGRGRKRKEPESSEHEHEPIKKKGRPRKQQSGIDDDKEVEEKVRLSLGRPSTGSVKWNIGPAKRKPGRPKKNLPIVAKTPNGTPKKRGRPSSNNKAKPYIKTGKPRGRPKANLAIQEIGVDTNEEQQNDSIYLDAVSDEAVEMQKDMSTPKKRGRPPKLNKSLNSTLIES